jgi:hypothetical protein
MAQWRDGAAVSWRCRGVGGGSGAVMVRRWYGYGVAAVRKSESVNHRSFGKN